MQVRYAGAASISLTTESGPSHGCRQCTYMQVRRATWWAPPCLPRALQSLERMSTSPCQERVVRPCKEQRYRSAGWPWRHQASGRRPSVSCHTEELHHGNVIRRGQPHRPLDEGHGQRLIVDSRGVMGQVRRNRMFLQAFAEGRGRCGILGKSHVISMAYVLYGV